MSLPTGVEDDDEDDDEDDEDDGSVVLPEGAESLAGAQGGPFIETMWG